MTCTSTLYFAADTAGTCKASLCSEGQCQDWESHSHRLPTSWSPFALTSSRLFCGRMFSGSVRVLVLGGVYFNYSVVLIFVYSRQISSNEFVYQPQQPGSHRGHYRILSSIPYAAVQVVIISFMYSRVSVSIPISQLASPPSCNLP